LVNIRQSGKCEPKQTQLSFPSLIEQPLKSQLWLRCHQPWLVCKREKRTQQKRNSQV